MTPEQARTLFSDAVDGELGPDRARAFEACLAADPLLKAEYEEFQRLLGGTRDLARPAGPPPDLLPGVQERLRARSRGRYYRDRFAERSARGAMAPLVMAAVLLIVVGVALFALHATDAGWMSGPLQPISSPE